MNRILDGLKTNMELNILPENIKLTTCGNNFSIMNMHLRFGCHSALSSGAIYSLVNVLLENPQIFEDYDFEDIASIRVRTFSKAYEMLGKLPRTDYPNSRQAAMFSIPYLLGRMLSKKKNLKGNVKRTFQDYYSRLALGPLDFTKVALKDDLTRNIMNKIDVIDGMKSYNKHFPEGIPSSLNIYFKDGKRFSSGMTKFPCGHAKNETVDTKAMMLNKFSIFWSSLNSVDYSKSEDLGAKGLDNRSLINFMINLQNIDEMDNSELTKLYNLNISFEGSNGIDE
mmetsp:Transcript_12239/g.10852  ORF Transcript_12239/g.10852 Transcript_12239/m.10852 type:complete len:282 (+) Transcript_12239:875-1720(+)